MQMLKREDANVVEPFDWNKAPVESPLFVHTVVEDNKEHFDPPEEVASKIAAVVEMVKASKNLVFFTGAGISTAAKLPDYRGPEGLWTLRLKGQEPKAGLPVEKAVPTLTHYAIKHLVDINVCKFLISTNVDGLHRRSGVPPQKLADLHGDCFRERCKKCNCVYTRLSSVLPPFLKWSCNDHRTNRQCDRCGQLLEDTIINFGELIDDNVLCTAIAHAKEADLVIVLGSSLRVPCSCHIPKLAKQMVICNLQKTPYDASAAVRIFARTDDFTRGLMTGLGIPEDRYARVAQPEPPADELQQWADTLPV
eukprot:TRINITY_DN2044_c0_g1_i2.p1 TRINITY_DN2044_c0_g1~~TRINITY_DN2044_c0_g1_i2.p1  ORF type:complete len:308 (-),score=91.20 TRINITY_DN2044_c0_g1_i2:161-1084(-)